MYVSIPPFISFPSACWICSHGCALPVYGGPHPPLVLYIPSFRLATSLLSTTTHLPNHRFINPDKNNPEHRQLPNGPRPDRLSTSKNRPLVIFKFRGTSCLSLSYSPARAFPLSPTTHLAASLCSQIPEPGNHQYLTLEAYPSHPTSPVVVSLLRESLYPREQPRHPWCL